MEADLTLPREEDADRALAGIRCRVTVLIVVDLQASRKTEENGVDETGFDTTWDIIIT